MDKDTKVKNMLKIFISGFPSFQIPYFPKRLINDKEEDILSLRLKDFLSKNQGEILEPLSINQEDIPRGGCKQFQLHVLSSSSSPSFTDLIIRDVASPPSSDRHFAGSYCAVDA